MAKAFTKAMLVDSTGVAISAANPLSMSIQPGTDAMLYVERSFQETDGAGTYTATVTIPAGATVLDVQWANQALWTAGTSATLNIGDADAAGGFFLNINVKAAPAIDGTTGGGISNFLSSTGSGTYKGLEKRYPSGGTITAAVVTVGATGHAGLSRLRVIYMLPTTVPTAVKV